MSDNGCHDEHALARALRDTCIERLQRDYEDAGMRGLCGEGAFEYALDRLRQVPAEELLAAIARNDSNPAQGTDP